MDWTNHVSATDMEYIKQNHGTERSRQLLRPAFFLGSREAILRVLNEDYHPSFKAGWRATKPEDLFFGLVDHAERKFETVFFDWDNHYGAPVQKGLATINAKFDKFTDHIKDFVNSRLTPPRRR